MILLKLSLKKVILLLKFIVQVSVPVKVQSVWHLYQNHHQPIIINNLQKTSYYLQNYKL